MTDELTRRQKAGAWATARRARDAREVSRGHVEAALAEARAPAKPLVVEPLPERLARLVPGARLENDPCSSTPWVVWRGLSILAAAHSPREAVDKAVMLFGRSR